MKIQRWLGAQVSRAVAISGLAGLVGLAGCGQGINDPYPASEQQANILYSAFTQRPKHLDPVQSYSEDEALFLYQIVEPPLQYHYLKRPYTLIPATLMAMPKVTLTDAQGHALPATTAPDKVAFTTYELQLKPGIRYQPHPAFALNPQQQPLYATQAAQSPAEWSRWLADKRGIPDFAEQATREVTAEDYVYQLKRLAHPRLHSPVFELMGDLIVGLRDLQQTLQQAAKAHRGAQADWLDLAQFPLAGAEVVDRYTWRIRLQGAYPQFAYWLAMPFFAPTAREVDQFYSLPGMAGKNLTLDFWPVGSGAYYLSENNPNSRMVLSRNPNFHGERYPCEGEPSDRAATYLADCGKALPLIDQVVFTREKESIPYWNKFLQGYYDASGVASDNFDQVVQMGGAGDVALTDEMRDKGIVLNAAVAPTVMYMGFNWLDPVVGGAVSDKAQAERNRKLRLALSIAIDQEEYISVFQNGRGVAAMSPLPPGLFGYRDGRAGMNPEVYDWVGEATGGKPQRKSIEVAKRWLAEAGYPDGRDARTGEPLVINLDTTLAGLGDKSRVDWLSKQFRKLGVQLVVRSTDYNRFQDKIRKGNAQLFYWGWNADYPDPENFLFLLYGPQGKVKNQGENAANYQNPAYDALFEQMKAMPDGPVRQAIIDKMVTILQHDAPWHFGFFEQVYSLNHGWLGNRKPGKMIRNTLKYQKVDVAQRRHLRGEWNQPLGWPAALLGLGILALLWPAVTHYRRQERATASQSAVDAGKGTSC